jgi:hypothetical protein
MDRGDTVKVVDVAVNEAEWRVYGKTNLRTTRNKLGNEVPGINRVLTAKLHFKRKEHEGGGPFAEHHGAKEGMRRKDTDSVVSAFDVHLESR